MNSRTMCAGLGTGLRGRNWPRLLAVSMVFLAMTTAASAEVIRISAATFVLRTAAGSTDAVGEDGVGLLQNAKGSFFAPVNFPNPGRVCRFILVYRDFDVDFQITARLMKKKIVIGGSPFAQPVVMAVVRTGVATANSGVMRKDTSAIAEPTTPSEAFYYVRLDLPATTLEVLGVEILHRPSCP